MSLFVVCALAVLALPLVIATSARLTSTGSAEFRARVLETVASAVHRGVAVEPQFLWLIAHDVRGRRRRAVRRAARDLDDGRSLSQALAGALRLPAEAVAVIAAAEGTPHLHAALRQAAATDRRRTAFRHELLVRLAYPALILTFLGGFLGLGIAPKFQNVCSSMGRDCSDFLAAFVVARVLGLGLCATAVFVAASGLGPVRAALGRCAGLRRTASAERTICWLHALAGAVRAGRPLDVALDRTATTIGHPRHVAGVAAAAEHVQNGEPLATAWTRLPVAGWLRTRAPLLGGPPALVAGALAELAQSAADRSEALHERLLRLLAPLLLTLTGGTLGLIFLMFFSVLQRLREMAVPW